MDTFDSILLVAVSVGLGGVVTWVTTIIRRMRAVENRLIKMETTLEHTSSLKVVFKEFKEELRKLSTLLLNNQKKR